MVVADMLRAGNIPKLLSPLHGHHIPLSVTAAAQNWGTMLHAGMESDSDSYRSLARRPGVTQRLSLCCQPSPVPEKMPFVKVTFFDPFKGLWSKGASLCLSLSGLERCHSLRGQQSRSHPAELSPA